MVNRETISSLVYYIKIIVIMKNLENVLSVEQLEERYEMSSLAGNKCVIRIGRETCPAYR